MKRNIFRKINFGHRNGFDEDWKAFSFACRFNFLDISTKLRTRELSFVRARHWFVHVINVTFHEGNLTTPRNWVVFSRRLLVNTISCLIKCNDVLVFSYCSPAILRPVAWSRKWYPKLVAKKWKNKFSTTFLCGLRHLQCRKASIYGSQQEPKTILWPRHYVLRN